MKKMTERELKELFHDNDYKHILRHFHEVFNASGLEKYLLDGHSLAGYRPEESDDVNSIKLLNSIVIKQNVEGTYRGLEYAIEAEAYLLNTLMTAIKSNYFLEFAIDCKSFLKELKEAYHIPDIIFQGIYSILNQLEFTFQVKRKFEEVFGEVSYNYSHPMYIAIYIWDKNYRFEIVENKYAQDMFNIKVLNSSHNPAISLIYNSLIESEELLKHFNVHELIEKARQQELKYLFKHQTLPQDFSMHTKSYALQNIEPMDKWRKLCFESTPFVLDFYLENDEQKKTRFNCFRANSCYIFAEQSIKVVCDSLDEFVDKMAENFNLKFSDRCLVNDNIVLI